MNVVFLCLGGNIGNREITLKKAVSFINSEIGFVKTFSKLYETEGWGVNNQDKYLNQCIILETNLSSEMVLKKILDIELKLGRNRNISSTYEPRTIDIDILFYNSDIINFPHLIIPHPRLHLRKFVLIPLNEIAKEFTHPILNKTIEMLHHACDDQCEVLLFK
ncbi:MAG: 2-amino-4-hydroxy-6-hydroxymethyldihydropteridine diphosphokinase [Bacteroidota bacterium]